MPEKEIITMAIINYDKEFFEHSLALLRQDIEVCTAYLRSDFRKEAPISEEAAHAVCRYQPKVMIHNQMIIREAIARNPR